MKELLWSFYLMGATILAQSNDVTFSQDSLRMDFELFHKVLVNYHPGLSRYKTPQELNSDLLKSHEEFTKSITLKDAFLNLHKATSKIECGHTYPNFWNQERNIQNELFNGEDKLPFSFVLLENEMIVHKNVSKIRLETGSAITHINGLSIFDIVQNLKNYARIDGNNMEKFFKDFSIEGFSKFEAFDIIFPLLYPPKKKQYSIIVRHLDGTVSSRYIKTVSRQQRKELLKERYADYFNNEKDEWDSSYPIDSVAVLKLGTFAVWNMDLDWKKFLEDFFKDKRTKKSKHLVLDLRGNEGGLMEVYWKLLTYLTKKPMKLERFEQLVTYEKVAPEHVQYLESWDKSVFDRTNQVVKKDVNFYEFNDDAVNFLEIAPSHFAFDGNIFVLMDAANSSAGFYLAKYLRENNLATLIGGISGGNQMGTNGGQFFMLKLPYTKLEVDVPLIGYFPREPAKDSGLVPDYHIERNYNYYHQKWILGIDLDYSKVLALTSGTIGKSE